MKLHNAGSGASAQRLLGASPPLLLGHGPCDNMDPAAFLCSNYYATLIWVFLLHLALTDAFCMPSVYFHLSGQRLDW